MDKIFYNESSSLKLGWKPDWFGVDNFDEDLIEAIKEFQKDFNLSPDGMCGPTTYRRLYTDRQSRILDFKPVDIADKNENFIVHRGNFFPIEWPKVVLWSDNNGLKPGKGYSSYFKERKINMFVNHWDVCLNSETCAKVLARRGISVHFCIDNDGTIYQLVDTNHACWHAGSKKWNHSSIGVEIANAYYPKYQSWYKRNGFGERPVINDESVHGRSMKPFLGFYPKQLDALKALWKACHEATGIPFKCPTDKQGNTLKKVSTSAASGRFKGFVSHYHLTRKKIDCAGLDIKSMLEDLKQ